ncbi:uncharacterized protein KY384_007720 [Bacidia gigantensis]|uniref:uncharacterized protein n=1 Tax=Bacidia gigantensis TaxID=2732470 RepID=UPI001D04AB61|nr:uncharacterized protein KY384_007720 [Bacidia gigantensis]KAG8527567.1 hypothetical protein KY384_007720 [Bacidia gigantensis]
MAPTKHIAQQLLERAHSPDAASAILSEKVLQKPLHLRPTAPNPTSQDARAGRRLQRLQKQGKTARKRRVKPVSAKEMRKLRIYEIPDDARKYELYVPLHKLWLGYMWEILGIGEGRTPFITADSKGGILTSADYHGALLKVVRSRCVGHVGLEGIAVRDTKFTFQIITRKNELKVIPKQHTVFHFELPQIPQEAGKESKGSGCEGNAIHHESISPNLVFELHGSQFLTRATDRGTKKFKQKYLRDL